MNRHVLIICAAFALAACATHDVWQKNYRPDEYLQVSNNSPTMRAELASSGLKYFCTGDLANPQQACYVEKTSAQKFGEFADALYKTPKAVLIDVGQTILVVGYIALEGTLCRHGCGTRYEIHP
jgi:hypothetical protein